MHIFLGLPISEPLADLDISKKKEYFELVDSIIRLLRANGKNTVFCALEAEGWGADITVPEQAMIRDLNEIQRASEIYFLFSKTYVTSALIELGWATALKKKVAILQHISAKPIYLVEGLAKNRKINIISYNDREELINEVSSLMNESSSHQSS